MSINHDFVSVDSGIELSDMFIENYIKWINVTHTKNPPKIKKTNGKHKNVHKKYLHNKQKRYSVLISGNRYRWLAYIYKQHYFYYN